MRRYHDIVFGPSKTAVSTVGCWWHGCALHFRPPTANAGWWIEKIERNRARDQDTLERMNEIGWHLEVVWEHDNLVDATDRIERIVQERRP